MKRTVCIGITALLLVTWMAPVFAGDVVIQSEPGRDRLTTFYNQHIDMEIAMAQEYISLKDTDSPKAKCFGERALKDVEFLKSQRQELVKRMLDANVGMQPYEVHYFLMNAFLEAHPEVRPLC